MKTKIRVYMSGKTISKIVSDDSDFEIEVIDSINLRPFDYRDIKTFEDACEKLDIDPLVLPDVSMITEDLQKSIVANYKLCIIYKAINNGWEPDYANPNEYKYYPYFMILSSGLDFSDSGCNCGGSAGTVVGVRLCTDTSAKAEYIGKQFKDIYKDYLL